ncbi:MAG: COG4315 family predicted lipoprotein [Actinomycetota bacterium]
MTSESTSAAPMPAPAAVEVKTASAAGYGTYLTNQQGMTLYVYLLDEPGSAPACTGDCLSSWTPVIVKGKPKAGSGVDAKTLGTQKVDGVQQLTLGGQPAYTYQGDMASGDTNGQGIGGLWFTVAPDGSRITGVTATASPSM